MKIKIKLLDYTLMGLLAGAVSPALAQDVVDAGSGHVAIQAPKDAAKIDCRADACTADEGLLFQLRTRSYDEPLTRGTSAASSSEALQPDRRVSIGLDSPGRAEAVGRFLIHLPGGGVVWATEDPALGEPELSVSAPSMVGFDGKAITKPVRFFVRGNYPAFIDHMEIALFRATDGDLIAPVARLPMDVAAVSESEWNGELPTAHPFRAGDELIYVLRAWDAEGNVDETAPRKLQLVRPEEAERGTLELRDSVEKSLGTARREIGRASCRERV